MAPLTITKEREKDVDFTKPFQNTGISLMIKKPEKQKPGVFSFKQPLSDQVWLCVTIGFFAVSLILSFVGRFSPYEWTEQDSKEPTNTFSLANTFWFSLGALMQQGSDISPRSASGRIAGSAWWFFTLILISSYTANLAAFLTVEKLLTPINSVDDLVGQTAIRYGILNSGSSYSFFNSSRVMVYEKMFKFMKETFPSVFVNSNHEGWKRVINSKGNYAYLLESAFNEYFNQKMPCSTMKVGKNLDHKGYGIATGIGSDLLSRLNLAVLELQETGELIELEQRWWYDKGECGIIDSKDHSQQALTLSNVSGIFHILLAGLLASMLVTLCDFLIRRKVQKSKKCEINNLKNNGTSKAPAQPSDARSNHTYGEITVIDTLQSTRITGFSYTT